MSNTRYFLGGNTSSGFHSLYHELSRPEEMQALYILKGGPGCGKSTLMRRVARHARAAGLDTEEIPCSGDPDSLDGLLLPALGTAIVDGTAPHVVEAGCPGAVDRYVDLSCFYDRQALQPLKEKLLSAAKEYRGHYKGAYRCLGAAGELGRNVWEAVSAPEVEEKLARRARGIIGRELKKTGGGAGRLSQRFLSALTCRGRLTLWETVEAQADRVYELRDQYGLAHQLLSPILAAALAAGHDVVACPDPLSPDRLAHLILPGLALAFVTSTPEQPWPHRPYRRLRLDAVPDAVRHQLNHPKLRFTRKVMAALEGEAGDGLARAKAAHDSLEGLYHPHVDFEGVHRAADALAEEILTAPAST